MSNRRADERGEKALAIFLDKYFYPKYMMENGCIGERRVFDAEEQKKGIDLILCRRGEEMRIDEKAQLHYIGSPVPSFAFEISFLRPGEFEPTPGWFVSEHSKTDNYLLVWIDKADTKELNRITAGDFEEIRAMMLDKKKMKQRLRDMAIADERIRDDAAVMRGTGETEKKYAPGIRLVYSQMYAEKPINLVVDLKTLEEWAEGYQTIRRG